MMAHNMQRYIHGLGLKTKVKAETMDLVLGPVIEIVRRFVVTDSFCDRCPNSKF